MKRTPLLVAVSVLVAASVQAQTARQGEPSLSSYAAFAAGSTTPSEAAASPSTDAAAPSTPGLGRTLVALFDRLSDAQRKSASARSISWLLPAAGMTSWQGDTDERRSESNVLALRTGNEVRGSGLELHGFDVVWSVQALGNASLLHRPEGALPWLSNRQAPYVWSRQPVDDNVDWVGLVSEQLRVDTLMHMKRLVEPKTRRALYAGIDHPIDGYFDAIGGYLKGPAQWQDGDGFVTNNINHPLMGAMYTHIFTNHDRRCQDVGYGDRGYWGCVRRAGIYAALASVNWEWNPLMSETSVGHVGTKRTCVNGACTGEGGWTDFVMTPLGGIGFRILGDVAQSKLWPVLDRHLSDNTLERILKGVLKVATDPGHSFNCALNLNFGAATRSRRTK